PLPSHLLGPAVGLQVTVLNPFNVVILFQPATLQCNYQTSATQPPIVTWKYKSYCRSRLANAFNPSSQESQLTDQLQQNIPGYNPYVECQDTVRTVRVVATKQGNAVTLGDFYQGRRITITNNADLSIEQTAWGDSGVYYCTVTSSQDLQGNNEAYAELIVLGWSAEASELLPGIEIGPLQDWLFVVLVALGALVLVLALGVCWCQCCPHTCCCYVRCPCCPQRCCCPEALYAAGKAATSGVPSVYAPSAYAPSLYGPSGALKPGPPPTLIPMGPVYNGYRADYDRASSVGGHSSQVPLLQDSHSTGSSGLRSGYRIQANQQDDSMRVLYYMEKELANFDATHPGPGNSRLERASVMSEISSLHEDTQRRAARGRPLSPLSDLEEEGSESRRLLPPTRRTRSRSVDDLDRDWSPVPERQGRGRPHESGSPHWREEERRGRRSRSRDDLWEPDPRSRANPWEPKGQGYDTELLRGVLRRKAQDDGDSGSSGRSLPPPPPAYSETESASSSRGRAERRLKRNQALSRESLVV
uniref:Lipolysis stimulated lipoprotein receptor n=2 Tax=Crocodylus porosus TaxID=8502 RepID=A0A7M4EJX0_CROPO